MLSLLIVGFVSVLVWAAYHTAERALLQSGLDRAQTAADEISSLTRPGLKQRMVDEQRLADRPSIAAYLRSGADADRVAALAALTSLPASGGQAVALWDTSGRLMLSSATPVAAAALLGAPPAPSGVGFTITKVGAKVVFDEVSGVHDGSDPSTPGPVIGYLTIRRFVVANGSGSAALNRLLGAGSRILLGGRTAGWTDLVDLVDGPPTALRPGTQGEWTVSGESRIGALSEIAGTPWLVWVDYPRAPVVAGALEFLKRMMVIGLACVALAIAIGYVLAASITRPLYALTAVSEAIAAGDYSRRVAAGRRDEIGRLGQAFNDMMAQIHAAHEQRVVERTALLLEANRTLAAEMDTRTRMELELRQAQKLESVGRLAAGVAHEINTPIQFVSDSLHFVRDAITEVSGVLQRYRALPEISTAEVRAGLVQAEEAADLPYLLDNMPKAIERALEGLDRVATIVRSMKEFAHPDQKDMTSTDLNQAIRSTLMVARNEYKYVADVELDLGEIPRVTCFGGDVNQAVLNIVVNAAHAIEDAVRGSERRGLITVRTRQENDQVVIAISDTGLGIPEAVQERIFDPFFTTKDVGKGTGQGLAIARSVLIDKHGGNLTFETTPGQGTTFFLRLPVAGSKHASVAA